MSSFLDRLLQFLAELKRRKVYRVAVAYLIAAFVVLQLAGLAAGAFGFPGWFEPMVWVLAGLGLPIALVLAWAFEVTPEGVRRTPDAAVRADGVAEEGEGWPWAPVLVLLVAVAAAAGVWTLAPLGADDGEPTTADARIAVLPFESIARDSGNAYFARGMHEEVISQLSTVAGLEVISRTSVTGLSGTADRIPEISRELGGVNAVLEGSVRRADDRVRITAQLIDAPEDEHLWSKTYDRRLSPEAIFDIQADIAEQISGALQAELTEGERRRIEETPTSDLAAYDAFLAGRNAWWQAVTVSDPVYVDSAIHRLRDAVRRDSTFGKAWAWLGLAYQVRYLVSDDARWSDSSSAAVSRAETLVPRSPIVYVVNAGRLQRRDSLEAAEREARRALRSKPSSGLAAFSLARIQWRQEEWVDRVRWAHRAVRLDPRRARYAVGLGAALERVGMDSLAGAWYRRARHLKPDDPRWVVRLVQLELAHGDVRTARQIVEEYRRDHGSHPGVLEVALDVAMTARAYDRAKQIIEQMPEARRDWYPEDSPTRPDEIRGADLWERQNLGLIELRTGQRVRGRALLSAVADSVRSRMRAARENGVPPATHRPQLAAVLAVLGERQRAMDQLSRAVEAGYDFAPWIRRSPFFEDLRTAARFDTILRRAQANRREFEEPLQRKVRQLEIDLTPPGMDRDYGRQR